MSLPLIKKDLFVVTYTVGLTPTFRPLKDLRLKVFEGLDFTTPSTHSEPPYNDDVDQFRQGSHKSLRDPCADVPGQKPNVSISGASSFPTRLGTFSIASKVRAPRAPLPPATSLPSTASHVSPLHRRAPVGPYSVTPRVPGRVVVYADGPQLPRLV